MKKLVFILGILIPILSVAQDQTINGNLVTKGEVFVGQDIPGKWGEGTRLHLRGTDRSTDPIWLSKYTAIKERTDLRVNVGDAFDPYDRFTVGYTRWDNNVWYDVFVIRMDGNVGVGVSQPTSKLEVNGTIRTNATIIGKQISTTPGEVDRLTITPYRHTGGPWVLSSRDTPTEAFLEFRYGVNKNLLTIQHQGNIGLGVANPTSKLEVNGTIRAKEVKIEATGWADFVFSPDYKLPSLAELKTHIQENKHLPNIPTEAEVKENGVDLGDMQMKLLQKIEELTLYVIEQQEEIISLRNEVNNLKSK